jgi:cysteine-rich repeat protein
MSRRTCPCLISLLVLTLGACGPNKNPDPGDGGLDAGSDAAQPDGWVWPDSGPLPDAEVAVCGNGHTETGEACDDGNVLSGDGCNSSCTLIDSWDAVGNFFTDGDQLEPALSCDASRVLAVFSTWTGGDGSGATVQARLFGADGMPRVAYHGSDWEFTVNTETVHHQATPRVALRAGGSGVVVWADESNATGARPDVRGRILADDGAGVGSDFLLSSDHAGDQATPAVAAGPDGGFLAVWVDNNPAGPDTSGFGIKGRLFDQYSIPQVNAQTGDDSAFQINQIHASTQFQVDVAWLGDRYLVVWSDGSGQLDGDSYGVVGALVDTGGNLLGPGSDFLINTTTAGLQASPRVAWQPGYGAVVVWTDESLAADPFHYGVRGRLLDFDGAGRTNGMDLTADDFQINTTLAGGQQLPAVSAQSDGDFLVVWQDWSAEDGSSASIRARLFTLSATPVVTALAPGGGDFQVNTTFWNSQLSPTVCATGTWFLAMWEDESAQAPDPTGTAIRYRLLPGGP